MSKWEMVRLGDVCEKGSSNIAQKDLENNFGDYPIFGASGIIKHVDFYKQSDEYIAIVKDGAGIGRTTLMPAKSSVIGTMQYIFPKKVIDIKYLFFAITYMNLAKYFTGATIPHIYFKDYCKEQFPLPPLDEQKRIAKNLDLASEIVKGYKEQLSELDKLVQSVFYEMFGDPVTNEKGWGISKLSALGELNRGVSKHRPRNAPELLGGNYPLIQTGEVSNSGLHITEYSNTYSDLGLKQSRLWSAGTLCITIAANIAQTAILAFDACFPDSVVGFISGKRTNQIFIHTWFGFFQRILEEQAPQVAQKNINLRILGDLNVIVPPLTLQTRFASIVTEVEAQKLQVQQALTEAENLFNSLMQEYFE